MTVWWIISFPQTFSNSFISLNHSSHSARSSQSFLDELRDEGKQVTALKRKKSKDNRRRWCFSGIKAQSEAFEMKANVWMNSFGGIVGKIAANAQVLMPALHHNGEWKHSSSCQLPRLSDTVQTKYNVRLQMSVSRWCESVDRIRALLLNQIRLVSGLLRQS